MSKSGMKLKGHFSYSKPLRNIPALCHYD